VVKRGRTPRCRRRLGSRAEGRKAKGKALNFSIKVNGQSHNVDVDPATPLLYVLSDDLGASRPEVSGCGLGQCGCCTVIVRGAAPFRAAFGGPLMRRTNADDERARRITTLEGLGTIERSPSDQKAFIDEQAISVRLLPERP